MTSVVEGPVIRFAIEPKFNLKQLDLTLSSDMEENIPFTTSPLDDSRGYAFKKPEVSVGATYGKKANKKKAVRR
jgi:hypothetical protein